MGIYLSPASLEHAEITENISFKKSLRGRFFKTSHASGGGSFALRRDFFRFPLPKVPTQAGSAAIKNNFISAISVGSVRDRL